MISGIIAAWREVRALVLGLAGFGVLAWFGKRRRWAGLALAFLGWVVYFFRDPDREPASSAPDLILAPADGNVTHVDIIYEPHYFKGAARRVSIFLSLFDVHVQRVPYPGTVEFLRYRSGSFAPAFLRDTQANEYNLIGMRTSHGPLVIKQIAGILARRIVCWVDLEDELAAGERLGLIRFGSRVDLLLPVGVEILAHEGQPVRGGQTIVARWKESPER